MNEVPSAPALLPHGARGATAITARHYQALCGLALATIFLVQLQHSGVTTPNALVLNLLGFAVGAICVLYRVRISPLYVFLGVAAPHVLERYGSNRLFDADFHHLRFDTAELLLCMATLTYLIGQYRLQGLWFGVLPPDARLPIPARPRSEQSLSAAELVTLIVPMPVCAVLAECACVFLKQGGTPLDLPPSWKQFLTLSWSLLLAMFLAAHGFRYWRRVRMDRVSARLLLQDILWNETRGEQRRIHRWLAWRKLRGRE